jgi:hypothetical protein
MGGGIGLELNYASRNGSFGTNGLLLYRLGSLLWYSYEFHVHLDEFNYVRIRFDGVCFAYSILFRLCFAIAYELTLYTNGEDLAC